MGADPQWRIYGGGWRLQPPSPWLAQNTHVSIELQIQNFLGEGPDPLQPLLNSFKPGSAPDPMSAGLIYDIPILRIYCPVAYKEPYSFPSKHETLSQYWFNVGPLSATLAQH